MVIERRRASDIMQTATEKSQKRVHTQKRVSREDREKRHDSDQTQGRAV